MRIGVADSEVIMETIIVSLIALALFVYLFIAMVHPEKF
jgi:K+-transporting ATPase KdpF subunit